MTTAAAAPIASLGLRISLQAAAGGLLLAGGAIWLTNQPRTFRFSSEDDTLGYVIDRTSDPALPRRNPRNAKGALPVVTQPATQPWQIAVLISSIDAVLSVRPANNPTKSAMVPVCRAALITPLPSGSKANSIFSPGLYLRCCRTSFLKVTCPRAVTVRVVRKFFSRLEAKLTNNEKFLTVKDFSQRVVGLAATLRSRIYGCSTSPAQCPLQPSPSKS